MLHSQLLPLAVADRLSNSLSLLRILPVFATCTQAASGARLSLQVLLTFSFFLGAALALLSGPRLCTVLGGSTGLSEPTVRLSDGCAAAVPPRRRAGAGSEELVYTPKAPGKAPRLATPAMILFFLGLLLAFRGGTVWTLHGAVPDVVLAWRAHACPGCFDIVSGGHAGSRGIINLSLAGCPCAPALAVWSCLGERVGEARHPGPPLCVDPAEPVHLEPDPPSHSGSVFRLGVCNPTGLKWETWACRGAPRRGVCCVGDPPNQAWLGTVPGGASDHEQRPSLYIGPAGGPPCTEHRDGAVLWCGIPFLFPYPGCSACLCP